MDPRKISSDCERIMKLFGVPAPWVGSADTGYAYWKREDITPEVATMYKEIHRLKNENAYLRDKNYKLGMELRNKSDNMDALRCAAGAFPRPSINVIQEVPNIKQVYFNDPVTVVIWANGDKTIVRATNEPYDPEKGLVMAIVKKLYGNKGNYYNKIKQWLPKEKEIMEEPSEPVITDWMTAAEAAECSGETVKTIQKHCREGRIMGATKENGKWKIPVYDR